MRDHMNFVLGAGGFLLILVYYAVNWLRHGRDPYGGVVVPRWDSPDGLAPSMLAYVDQKSFFNGGWTRLSATALDMAVKGYVEMSDVENSITMVRTAKPAPADLQPGEKAFLDSFRGTGTTLTINKANGKRIQTVGSNFTSAVSKAAAGKYHHFNAGSSFSRADLDHRLCLLHRSLRRHTDSLLGMLIVPRSSPSSSASS